MLDEAVGDDADELVPPTAAEAAGLVGSLATGNCAVELGRDCVVCLASRLISLDPSEILVIVA